MLSLFYLQLSVDHNHFIDNFDKGSVVIAVPVDQAGNSHLELVQAQVLQEGWTGEEEELWRRLGLLQVEQHVPLQLLSCVHQTQFVALGAQDVFPLAASSRQHS